MFHGYLTFTGTNQPLIFSFGVKYLSKCAFFCPAVPTINLGTFSHTSPSPSFILFSKTSALLLKQLNIILSPSLLLQVQCKPSSSSLISLLTNTFFFRGATVITNNWSRQFPAKCLVGFHCTYDKTPNLSNCSYRDPAPESLPSPFLTACLLIPKCGRLFPVLCQRWAFLSWKHFFFFFLLSFFLLSSICWNQWPSMLATNYNHSGEILIHASTQTSFLASVLFVWSRARHS